MSTDKRDVRILALAQSLHFLAPLLPPTLYTITRHALYPYNMQPFTAPALVLGFAGEDNHVEVDVAARAVHVLFLYNLGDVL